MQISHILEKDYKEDDRFLVFKPLSRSLSIQDIATLVETMEAFLEEPGVFYIKEIVEHPRGYFVFISDRRVTDFDFYQFLNTHSRDEKAISCANVKYLFPRMLSRGVFQDTFFHENSVEDDGEDRTGFMDLDEVPKSLKRPVVKHIFHARTNSDIFVPNEGVVIGRSEKYADFVLDDNTNISRKHCRLYRDGDVVKIHDFETPNGTFVNSARVSPTDDIIVNVGDILLLADEKFKIY